MPSLGEGWGGAFRGPGRGVRSTGEGLLQSSCFCTGASRTFFTANGGFFYRGYCWRHAWHDGGDGADAQEKNLFSDRHWRHHHQGEAASSAHGFLCLFQPLPNPPQREGVPPNCLKHSKNELPPLWEGWGGASIHHPKPPQRDSAPPNRIKHSRNGLPPLGEGRGGATNYPPHPS